MDLTGQVAVVTGGASGIGAACVTLLRDAGARVISWDLGDGEETITCDVRDPDSVEAAHAETVRRWGLPSVLVTAAGIGGFSRLTSMDLEHWEQVLRVNLTGTMLCLRTFANALIEAERPGAAVTVSSVNGRLPDRGMSAYCASKAGVEMFTRVAAAELGPHLIRVNAIAPGVTDTPLLSGSKYLPGFSEGIRESTPLGHRLGTSEDVADAVLCLLGARWVTGQVLAADGGLLLDSPVNPWDAIDRFESGSARD